MLYDFLGWHHTLAIWNIDAYTIQTQGFTIFIRNPKFVDFSDELPLAFNP
jgi:hypothetical protein